MFLDFQLPDGPGDQVYETAKQIDPDLAIIVITGYPESKILGRLLQVSPVTVLEKPLKAELLNRTVKIIGQHRHPGDLRPPSILLQLLESSAFFFEAEDNSLTVESESL